MAPDEGTSPALNEEEVEQVQLIAHALMYCGRAVDTKLWVALRIIASYQSAATYKK